MGKVASQNNWLDAAAATWPECRDFLARTPCAILPLGATEQHGPHLPQNTDTVIAEALALGVARQSVGLVLPPVPIGYSWVWRDWAGSLSFSFDTFREVIKDVARSLDRNGCKALMVLTAHGANPQPLKYTARELADEIEMAMLRMFYPDLDEIVADAGLVGVAVVEFSRRGVRDVADAVPAPGPGADGPGGGGVPAAFAGLRDVDAADGGVERIGGCSAMRR